MTPAPKPAVKLVALDDHPLLIEGIVSVFSRDCGYSVTWHGTASTLREFADLLSAVGDDEVPDLALIDLNLPDASSPADAVALAVARGIRCIVVTAEARAIPIRKAVQAGAQALYLKHEPVEHFTDVVGQVLSGEQVVTSEIAAALLDDPSVVYEITPRELQTMQLIADGVPRKSVGRFIGRGISEATVSTHLNNVVAKYRERGRAMGNTIELLRELRRDGHLAVEL